MAQLIVSAAAATVGYFIGGPTGASIGWSIGSALGSSLGPAQHNDGPRLEDLRATKVQYGAAVPRIYGRRRVAGAMIWSSEKHETATETEAGKGGPSVVNTTYTYDIDGIWWLSDNIGNVGVSRVWINGELVYSVLSESSEATVTASAATDRWTSITFLDGNASQMPWPVYEAAVGSANAVAYRHRTCVAIEGLQLGSSDQIPLIEFELITAGTLAGAKTRLQSYFDGNSSADISAYENGSGVLAGNALITTGQFSVNDTSGAGGTLTYDNAYTISDGSTPVTIELYVTWNSTPNATPLPFMKWIPNVANAANFDRLQFHANAGIVQWVWGGYQTPSPISGRTHFRIVYTASVSTLYINGSPVATGPGLPVASANAGRFILGGDGYADATPVSYTIDEFAFRWQQMNTGAFTPPTHIDPPDDATIAPATVDLADIVSAECLRCTPLVASDINVTALVGIPVIGFTAQAAASAALEELMSIFWFEWVSRDKLIAVRRGGSSAATLTAAETGAGNESAGDSFAGYDRGAPIEVPIKVSLTYAKLSADYENDTQDSDRQIGDSVSVDKKQTAVVMDAATAKGRAISMSADARVAAHSASVALTDKRAALEVTDVITSADESGTSYRGRAVREGYANGVKTFELVLDDSSILIDSGITSDNSTPSIVVLPPAEADTLWLDMPILRDADNDPGYYIAGKGTGSNYRGQVTYESLSGEYVKTATIPESAVFGVTTTVLAAWSGDDVFDETSSVTVDLAGGTAQSFTRDEILNGTAKGWLIGSEVLYARTATLVSAGVYTLTGLLRGRRGTEWATGSHASGERAVLLQTTGLRRGARQAGELGVTYNVKGVSIGATLASAEPASFVDTGIGLKPFAPVDLRATRQGNGSIRLTWKRRTRLSTRFTGDSGISVPLGEVSEQYTVAIYSSGSYATLLRTLSATSASVDWTLDQQEEDLGSAPSIVYAKVYQVSASVGAGYALTASAIVGERSYASPLSTNSYPDARLAYGTRFLLTRNGQTTMALYRWTVGDANAELLGVVAADNTYRYLQGAHSWAGDGAGKWVMYLRAYTNPASLRKLVYGDLVAGSFAVVTPTFMPNNPPFALGHDGTNFIALTVDGTRYTSSDGGASWSSAGAFTGVTLPPSAADFSGGKICRIGSTLTMVFAGSLYYSTNSGASWSAVGGDVASDDATYDSTYWVFGIATTGSVSCVMARGRTTTDPQLKAIIYTSTDGQTFTRRATNNPGGTETFTLNAFGVLEFGGNFYTLIEGTPPDAGMTSVGTIGTWSGAAVKNAPEVFAHLAVSGSSRFAGVGLFSASDSIVASLNGDVFTETIGWPT